MISSAIFRTVTLAGPSVHLDHPAGKALVHPGLQSDFWRDIMSTKRGLLGYYNYTVILTYIGMLVAFVGIATALDGNFKKAVICLMVAGVCDMFDGAIASTRPRMPKERRFGIQIDSLCDLICFGVFPALMVYTANNPFPGGPGCVLGLCTLRLDPAGLLQRIGGGASGLHPGASDKLPGYAGDHHRPVAACPVRLGQDGGALHGGWQPGAAVCGGRGVPAAGAHQKAPSHRPGHHADRGSL